MLRRALDKGEGAQKLVDLITPFLDNEVIVMNSNFRVVAHSYENIELYRVSSIEAPDNDEFVPLEVASFFQNGTIYRDVQTVLDLVSAGRGIAFVGGHNISRHPDLLFKRLADLEKPITAPVSLIWLTEREKYRSIARHIAMLKAAFEDIAKTDGFRQASVIQP